MDAPFYFIQIHDRLIVYCKCPGAEPLSNSHFDARRDS